MQKWEFDDVTLERFMVGMLEVNCYLLYSHNSVILIDPGFPEDKLLLRIRVLGDLDSKTVLLTHGHFDHTTACLLLQEKGWKVGVHPKDRFLLGRVSPEFACLGYPDSAFEPDLLLEDGMSFAVGQVEIEAVSTPGHSPGSMCFIERKKRWAFTGDTLFADSIGRSDLSGGDDQVLMDSICKLRELLRPDTLVLSGHGGRALFSTVVRINPFLQG